MKLVLLLCICIPMGGYFGSVGGAAAWTTLALMMFGIDNFPSFPVGQLVGGLIGGIAGAYVAVTMVKDEQKVTKRDAAKRAAAVEDSPEE